LPGNIYFRLLKKLPEPIREINGRYRQGNDKLLHLFGNLLLIEAFQHVRPEPACLDKLRYNEYGRPYMDDSGGIDFNKSHSGKYAICGIGKDIRIGVDIEEIKPVDFNDFTGVMTSDQWEAIRSSGDPTRSFFRYWTIKESILKADSRGLSIPPSSIQISGNTGICEGRIWHLTELNIAEGYCACLSADLGNSKIQARHIHHSDFYY
jgi:4'-phosphopantetheinyl transferase